jgi:hypothetical protein
MHDLLRRDGFRWISGANPEGHATVDSRGLLRHLGVGIAYCSAVLDALTKVSLCILTRSLCAACGGIADHAGRKCLGSQRLALFGEFDRDGRGATH